MPQRGRAGADVVLVVRSSVTRPVLTRSLSGDSVNVNGVGLLANMALLDRPWWARGREGAREQRAGGGDATKHMSQWWRAPAGVYQEVRAQ